MITTFGIWVSALTGAMDMAIEQDFGVWVLIPITIELTIITWWVTRP